MTKKILFTIALCTILPLQCFVYGQPAHDFYHKWWQVINTDTIGKEEKLRYLDLYIEKAHGEKNYLEEYRALKKKTYLLSFNQAVMLLHKMNPLVQNLKNDSLTGDFFNRSTTLYYKNRSFKEALDYAIQAEKFNENINSQYNLNAARIDIGNIYYHTQRYDKAKAYFTNAKEYYKGSDNYNHVQGYVSSLYSLGKCYLRLEELVALQETIQESEQTLAKLKPQDRIIETAYLNYLKGGKALLMKDYHTAQSYFKNALPEILKNEDVANEHVVYMYLGKIKWAQNKKQEAVAYFTKIDHLFKENKFLNYELREAYDYLRTYYKETKQTELQLEVTESLIALNQQFEKEQQYLTDVLHYQLDTEQLESEKTVLQKQLNNNSAPYGFWLAALGIIATCAGGGFLFWKKQKKKQMPLLNVKQKISKEPVNEQQPVELSLVGVSKELHKAYEAPQPETEEKEQLTPTEQRLLEKLNVFEAEKKYKKTITLDQLAAQLGTNRTTLSNFLNTHKGGYNNYFSKLRVSAVVNDLKSNKELRNKTLQELAFCYGFPNAKAFSSQFKTDVGVSPLDFIKEINTLDTQNLSLEL